jgi:hypothetical protein
MQSKLTVILIAVLALVLSAAASADAKTLTVGNGSALESNTVQIPIIVDDPVDIAGAAFTIQYDGASLTLSAVESDFFDTFANQWTALSLNPSPPDSVEVDSVTYDQPLVDNRVTGTGTLVAAARCAAETSSAKKILFLLTFALNAGSPAGKYPVSVIPTTLNNTDAGYHEDGETIAMLIGADATKEPTDDAAFPILIGPNGSTVPGNIIFFGPGTDIDEDNLPDDWEQQIVDYNLNDEITTIEQVLPEDDFDEDTHTNQSEYTNGTDPTDPNDPPGSKSKAMPWIPLLLLGD